MFFNLLMIRMMDGYRGLCLFVALLVIVACSSEKKKESTEIGKSEKKQQLIMVDTMALRKQSFQKQMICNGKLRAVVKSDINFNAAGVISAIYGVNGDYVEKEKVIATLDDKEALIELEKCKREMERADIDLLDKLIGQGYAGDTAAVPAAVLRNMKISSGYSNALDLLNAAERRLADCYLKAPFGGRIANLDMKVYDRSGNKLCTLIDDSYFDVEFNVLEAEIEDVALKQRVKVVPFVNEEKVFYGMVTEINPFIDEYGQVKIRARVENAGRYLVEGMNVKLVLEREVKDCFVVPKDAVVLRDGFQVVFCYKEGKAVWTYVDVVMSNINSHVITGCKEKQTTVTEKDVVITSNNLNLADGTDVTPNRRIQK